MHPVDFILIPLFQGMETLRKKPPKPYNLFLYTYMPIIMKLGLISFNLYAHFHYVSFCFNGVISGYGNITPKTTIGRMVTIVYAFIGIPLTMICLANLGHILSISFKVLYRRLNCNTKKRNSSNSTSDSSAKCLVMNSQVVKPELDDTEVAMAMSENTCAKVREIRVPIYVCFLLVVAYILLGTLLFSLWESWDPLKAGYFCFITLSTIGFGDVVPGHSLDSWSSQAKRITCALYLLFGLTLISMCFSLMVDEVQEKARTFGRWIGLLQREEN